ncbi:unnamed protein product [Blepharisma stoltei]|uniref:Serine aminopeptidase S33 domain-containing protein n=1 Tax=Blepharisma stoltei TaxID=1481888 RepID=A0AAU9JA58_9CILI|nr:unnamed protein product [Blepharisma stoltei]
MGLIECCFGCFTIFGCRSRMVRFFSFFPPKPASYEIITVNDEPMIFLNKQTDNLIDLPWLKFSVAFLDTEENETIPMLYIKHETAYYTVIFSHGNSADIGIMRNYLIEFSTQLNVSVIVYEYTGYGQSTGKPSEKSLYADIRAAYNHTINNLEIPWDRIILYGHSIGSGPTCDLASEFSVGGIVLQSPIASGLRIFSKKLKKSSKYDLFNNIDKTPFIRCPVFIIHGTLDKEVPIRHGQWLHSKLNLAYPPYWVPGAGHNNIEILHKQEFFSALRKFITDLNKFHKSENSNNYDSLKPLSPKSNRQEASKVAYWPTNSEVTEPQKDNTNIN